MITDGGVLSGLLAGAITFFLLSLPSLVGKVRKRGSGHTVRVYADFLEIGGAILIVAGIGLWSVPLALVVAGAACIFLAQGMEARE